MLLTPFHFFFPPISSLCSFFPSSIFPFVVVCAQRAARAAMQPYKCPNIAPPTPRVGETHNFVFLQPPPRTKEEQKKMMWVFDSKINEKTKTRQKTKCCINRSSDVAIALHIVSCPPQNKKGMINNHHHLFSTKLCNYYNREDKDDIGRGYQIAKMNH